MKFPAYHSTAAALAAVALLAGSAAAQITMTPEQTVPAPEQPPSVQELQTAPGADGMQSLGEYAADAVVTTKIKASLIAESTVNALRIAPLPK